MAYICTFTLTLSSAPTVAASCAYTTVDGTAVAGTDYTAESGTINFGVGVLTQTVVIPILADPTANVAKAFSLALSNPVNMTLPSPASATGVISTATNVNLPTVSITGVTITTAAVRPNDQIQVGSGALQNQFIDSTGAPFRIKAIAWYGFEGEDLLVHSLYANRGYKDVINQMRALGFNCLRIPFADDMLTSTLTFTTTSGNQYVTSSVNPDLIGLTPLQAFDAIVYYCSLVGVYVIVDHHRISIDSIHSHAVTTLTNPNSEFINIDNTVDLAEGMTVSCHTAGLIDPTAKVTAISSSTIAISPSTLASIPEGTMLGFNDSGYGTDGWPAADGTSGLYTYGGSTTPAAYTGVNWANMWKSFATHCTSNNTVPGITGAGQYASNATLKNTIIGYESHNEPFRPNWSVWKGMNETLDPQVRAIAPNWIIFVQGVGASADGTDKYWEGGYLRSATSGSVDGAAAPINTSIIPANRLAYSAHEYGLSVYDQPWLSSAASNPGGQYPTLVDQSVANYPNNLEAVFDTYYGNIYNENIGPVWVSEFGYGIGLAYDTGLTDSNQLPANVAFETAWAKKVVAYLNGERGNGTTAAIQANPKGMSFSYWSFNPESGPPLGGLVIEADYETVQTAKMDILLPLLALQA